MEEQRRLLVNQSDSTMQESSGEEWSDESGSESYYSDSDSSIPEWESSIDDNTGELLFINCHPFVTQNNIDTNKPKQPSEPFTRNHQNRRSTRGKFLRLIRRRESKRYSRRYQKAHDNSDTGTNIASTTATNKVKFQDSQQGEEKEVILKINNDNKQSVNLSLSEKLLGISVSTLSDGNRIMIAGFVPDSEAKHEKTIKIGDWLKSINNIEVCYQNLNSVLEKISNRNDVLLKLQRVAGVEVTKDPPINELNCQSKFVKQLINSGIYREQIMELLLKYPIGVLYLNTDNLNENNTEYEDVIYCYPRPYQKSLLCNSRGMFITINHLIGDITKTKPKTSSILYDDKVSNIVYTNLDAKLFLLMLPEYCANLKEILMINEQIVRLFEFLYLDFDQCFSNETNRNQIDNYFERLFTKLLNNGVWITPEHFLTLQDNIGNITNSTRFEEIVPAAKFLQLPNEAYMQIDDALTELEASDYREWNEEPLDCQRLFTILGSAFYHYGYLLASHLMCEDLIDIHNYCEQQGLFYLSRTEPVKTLVLWKEVYPYSCNRFDTNLNLKIPNGRRYLLVVGSGKNLLAVIMEAGGCTEPPEPNMGPDAFYVEEAQATLQHIQELGLPELADRWLSMNPGKQITIPEIINRKKDFLIDNLNRTIAGQQNREQNREVTSILKRRNSDQIHVLHGSTTTTTTTHSTISLNDDHSEDSSNSQICEDGRRRNSRYDSNDDESGSDDYGEDGQMSNNSFDISELRQTLLTETEDIQPQQLTTGNENVLFHFIQLETTDGILICPPECRLKSQTLDVVLDNFRKCCHKIHQLFQNTLRFKNMPAQDMAKSVMNKSLVAIKEHGVMFECPFLDDGGDNSRKHKIKYWVVGRLFYMPHPKEVYICYQDSIPQNIVELAFKIDLSTCI